MIFKQVEEILLGRKTQTRRVCKPGQELFDALIRGRGGDEEDWYPTGLYNAKETDPETWEFRHNPEYTNIHALYIVGRTYAVQPGRGQPAVWWKPTDGGGVELLHEHPEFPAFRGLVNTSRSTWQLALEDLKEVGWQPLRICITDIRQECLQDITEADAQAEGVESVEAYRGLWESINGKTKGARWDDNPLVYVLSFEVVK